MNSLAPAFDPSYPNASSIEYRDSFIRGAGAAGLRDIPANILSWAIDRATAAKTPPVTAGRVFADTYYKIQQRREPRSGYGSPTAYLLAVYQQALNNKL